MYVILRRYSKEIGWSVVQSLEPTEKSARHTCKGIRAYETAGRSELRIVPLMGVADWIDPDRE